MKTQVEKKYLESIQEKKITHDTQNIDCMIMAFSSENGNEQEMKQNLKVTKEDNCEPTILYPVGRT